jgi:hypothetical protein
MRLQQLWRPAREPAEHWSPQKPQKRQRSGKRGWHRHRYVLQPMPSMLGLPVPRQLQQRHPCAQRSKRPWRRRPPASRMRLCKHVLLPPLPLPPSLPVKLLVHLGGWHRPQHHQQHHLYIVPVSYRSMTPAVLHLPPAFPFPSPTTGWAAPAAVCTVHARTGHSAVGPRSPPTGRPVRTWRRRTAAGRLCGCPCCRWPSLTRMNRRCPPRRLGGRHT